MKIHPLFFFKYKIKFEKNRKYMRTCQDASIYQTGNLNSKVTSSFNRLWLFETFL